MTVVAQFLEEEHGRAVATYAQQALGELIQKQQYVGEVFSLGYESALVQIHDYYRQRVGGIPSLSLLIATRLVPNAEIEFTEEDASIILLRVMDAAPLPNDQEAGRLRVESAQRVSGELDQHWDSTTAMDERTANLLSFAGVKCRVIGTFFLAENPNASMGTPLILRFGSDISNYYPNKGLKVYKPNGEALRRIVNFRDPDRVDPNTHPVNVGQVRYASTNRAFQGVSDVGVDIVPEDLLGQKTALFGMTRTGKSNTTKIILQSIFNLRFAQSQRRIGQIVFDPNGEYANENVQDANGQNPNAIKNVWRSNPAGDQEDVVTYGITTHPNDPNRRLMLLNFHVDRNRQVGKEIIDATLANDSSIYIRNFRNVRFDPPAATDRSATTRFQRRVLVYRALLERAGFAAPANLSPMIRGLFSQELRGALNGSTADNNTDHMSAATILGSANPTWQQLATAFTAMADFIAHPNNGYSAFDQWYINDRPDASGDPWADEDLKKLLEMFRYANGPRLIGQV